jgi:hypothetical protein
MGYETSMLYTLSGRLTAATGVDERVSQYYYSLSMQEAIRG